MTAKTLGYWIVTAILALELLVGGVMDLIRWPPIMSVLVHLGYPAYVATIIGCWKVPGAVVLVTPGMPRLKEWAYAGAFFEMTGAVASQVAHGDSAVSLIAPIVFSVLTIFSWALRPKSRMLAQSVS